MATTAADIARDAVGPQRVFVAGGAFLVDTTDDQRRVVRALAAAGYEVTTGTAKFPGRPIRKRCVRVGGIRS